MHISHIYTFQEKVSKKGVVSLNPLKVKDSVKRLQQQSLITKTSSRRKNTLFSKVCYFKLYQSNCLTMKITYLGLHFYFISLHFYFIIFFLPNNVLTSKLSCCIKLASLQSLEEDVASSATCLAIQRPKLPAIFPKLSLSKTPHSMHSINSSRQSLIVIFFFLHRLSSAYEAQALQIYVEWGNKSPFSMRALVACFLTFSPSFLNPTNSFPSEQMPCCLQLQFPLGWHIYHIIKLH